MLEDSEYRIFWSFWSHPQVVYKNQGNSAFITKPWAISLHSIASHDPVIYWYTRNAIIEAVTDAASKAFICVHCGEPCYEQWNQISWNPSGTQVSEIPLDFPIKSSSGFFWKRKKLMKQQSRLKIPVSVGLWGYAKLGFVPILPWCNPILPWSL